MTFTKHFLKIISATPVGKKKKKSKVIFERRRRGRRYILFQF